MNKTTENIILSGIAAGLALAVMILNSDIPTNRSHGGDEDIDNVKRIIKKSYKHADDEDISDDYREDVFVGVYNRNLTYIEVNAMEGDHEELYAYNEKMYKRYL